MPKRLRPASQHARVLAFGGPAPKLELYLAIKSLAIGLWLLAPWETFASSRGWDAAARLAPENIWGAAFALVGGSLIAALVANRRYPTMALLALLVWMWVAIAYTFFVGNPRGIAALWTIWTALATVWCLLIRANAGRGSWEWRV